MSSPHSNYLSSFMKPVPFPNQINPFLLGLQNSMLHPLSLLYLQSLTFNCNNWVSSNLTAQQINNQALLNSKLIRQNHLHSFNFNEQMNNIPFETNTPLNCSIEAKKFTEFDITTRNDQINKCDIEFQNLIYSISSIDKNSINFIVSKFVTQNNLFSESTFGKEKLIKSSFKNPEIFDIIYSLIEKYGTIKKTREEYSKFLFRKAFKFLKKKLLNEKKGVLKKHLNRLFLKKFFSIKEESCTGKNSDLDCLLPFKKNSIIKRVNEKYIKLLFSNEDFRKGFKEFYDSYEEFVNIENKKKIEQLVKKILNLYKTKNLQKINEIQHLPWLSNWIQNAKKMGEKILEEIKE